MYAVTKSDTLMNIAYHEVSSLLTERNKYCSVEKGNVYIW